MTIKTKKEVEAVESVNRFVECDLDPCFNTDEVTTVFELPITPTDTKEGAILHMCVECLSSLYGSGDFDYIGEVEASPNGGIEIEAVEEKKVPGSVALTVGLIPFFTVVVFNFLFLIFYTPGIIGWGILAFLSAFLYGVIAMASAEQKFGEEYKGI